MTTATTFADEKEATEEVAWNILLLGYQTLALLALIPAFLILCVTEWWNPDFFDFPYWHYTSPEMIGAFWPLFVYGGIMATLSSIGLVSTSADHSIFTLDVITSTLAGLWEEFAFRWLYICTAMLMLWWFNWAWSFILCIFLGGIVAAGGIFVFMLSSEVKGIVRLLLAIVGLALVCAGIYIAWQVYWGTNPVYWVYEVLFVPTVNFVTAGYFRQLFYDDHPRLFVFGMIAANAAFRDGHKYQGLYGFWNSWIIGFVMMHATLSYGLWTAVAIHVIYDLEFAFIRFAARTLRS